MGQYTSALQYVPELTWILFLRLLDAQEARDQEKAAVVGAVFAPALRSPYRWQDWAAPWSDKPGHPKTDEGKPYGWKRQELFAAGMASCLPSSTTNCCLTFTVSTPNL